MLLARRVRIAIFGLLSLLLFAACGSSSSPGSGGTVTLNLGYFANLTHSVALVGVGNGTFKKDLGSGVNLQTKTFNAGPAEIQALLAGSIDIAFVGPAPAVNGYTQSHNAALKVIAGASSAGVQFVIQGNSTITTPADLANKKLATPQKGGTQDVALRHYLQQNGLTTNDKGGNVQITSTDNANILNLFKEGKIDGAWMPEPWATRLIVEGKGKAFLNEKTLWPGGQFATTIIVVRQAFYTAHTDLVKKFLESDINVVQYIKANPTQAQQIANDQIKAITGSPVKADELPIAFGDLEVTYDPLASTITEQANRSFSLGFVSSKPDLAALYNLGPLNEVLSAKGLATIATS
ncbi:MAG TPA: ABC transporter substrate-binding protein [Ktedonobacteraceae bacterium]|nr:ABC transporter substrate-binding protein [Ktedonobacteraceae bacterium]